MQVCQVSASSSLRFLRRRFFIFFPENLPFMWPCQPIKLSDLDKSRMKHGGLLNKYICEKIQIPPVRQQKLSISTFPIISLWELLVAIATTVLIRWNKNIIFVEGNVLSKYAKFQFHLRYGFREKDF